MNQPKHTPGPWQVNKKVKTSVETAIDGQGINLIADCSDCDGERLRTEDEANAQFIVRACNSHYILLEACKFMLSEMIQVEPSSDLPEYEGYKKLRDILEQAIKKATGEA